MNSLTPDETNDDSWADDLDAETYVSPLASGVTEDAEEIDEANFDDLVDEVNEDDFVDLDTDEESDEDETVEALEGIVVASDAPSDSLDFDRALTLEEAQELTEHIRSTADVLYVLIARAHAGKAYIALGYSSFESYVKTEFDISRSRAYQFLNQANVIEAITAAAPEGTRIKVSEAAARDLKNFVNELSPDIREKTEGVSPDDAGAIVDELVKEYREKSKKPVEEEDDFNIDELDLDDIDFEIPEYGSDNNEGGGSKGSQFDDIDGFDDLDDIDAGSEVKAGFDDDPLAFRAKVENTYNFYAAIHSLEKMPDAQEVAEAIPDARRSQINTTLPKVLLWLQDFSEKWNSLHADDAPLEDKDLEDLDLSDVDLDDFADIEGKD